MMDWHGPTFIVLIIAISTLGWLINNWIRAKHGYALEDEYGGKSERAETIANQALQQENAALRSELRTVHDRVAVLERIVTDKGYGLSDEIEALRRTGRVEEGSGVPLSLTEREKAK